MPESCLRLPSRQVTVKSAATSPGRFFMAISNR